MKEEDKQAYLDDLVSRGIPKDKLIGFNRNPYEEEDTKVASFKEKPYFSILIDDKAGFCPEEDWLDLYGYVLTYKDM